ncbi:MAG: hypothetical protein WCI05_06050 [Myxococcales bacterium]
MNAIKIETTVSETMVNVFPVFRPLLGKYVEIIALEIPTNELTFDEFLRTRLERPEGVAPVTLEDIEHAIAKGASET